MSHGIRHRRRLVSYCAGLAALAALWSCDGQNVFSPGGISTDGAGPTIEIRTPREPAARPVGDSVLIVAHARDDVGVDSVLFAGISYRGDKNLGTDTVVVRYYSKMIRFAGSVSDTTVSRYLMAAPDTTREISTIFAIAYDTGGNISADTVSMTIGGPRVTFLTLEDGLQIQSGLSLNLQVEAADPEGVLDLTILISGVFDRVIEIPFIPTGEVRSGGHRRGHSRRPHRIYRCVRHRPKRPGGSGSGWTHPPGDRGFRNRRRDTAGIVCILLLHPADWSWMIPLKWWFQGPTTTRAPASPASGIR